VTPPTLLTERLELRPPVASDFPEALAIASHTNTSRFLGPPKGPADHFLRFCRSAGSWLLYGYGVFVVRPHGERDVVGTCGVFHGWRDLGTDFDDQPEAGWMLRSDWHGRGIGYEAMSAVLEWFDRTHFRRIVCMIDPGNAPSIRLAEKLGFQALREASPDGETMRLFERSARAP
jgi:RimJ/RimL family protein N-acetyltransferase